MKILIGTICLIIGLSIGYNIPSPPKDLGVGAEITVDDINLPKGTTYEKDYIDVRCYVGDRLICNDIYNGKEIMNADNNN